MNYEELTMEELRAAYNAVKSEMAALKTNMNAINAVIEGRLAPHMNGYGTTHQEIDGVPVKLVLSKNIAWDDAKLAGLYMRIQTDGANPDEYIKKKVTYTVSENAYKEWSQDMKDAFADARTEKEPKFSFEFEDAK